MHWNQNAHQRGNPNQLGVSNLNEADLARRLAIGSDIAHRCGVMALIRAAPTIVDLVQLDRKRKGKKLQRGRSTC